MCKKSILAIILFMACWQSALAQNTVESIRQRYQAMKEYVATHQGADKWDGADFGLFYHLEGRQWLPGTGGHIEDTYLYYGEEECDDSVIYAPHYLQFVTKRYNYAARKYYEEYLYDTDGQVAFIYAYDPMTQFEDETEDRQYEFRFYFNKGKLLKAIVKCKNYDEQQFKEVWNAKTLKPAYHGTLDTYKGVAEQMRQLFIDIEKEAY